MGFLNFLSESIQYQSVEPSQMSIIRQSFNRNDLVESVKKEYIEKSESNCKLVDSDFYISGMTLYQDTKVAVQGMFIVEVTEEDGYIYFKHVQFEYCLDDSELLSVKDIDRIRDENWKNVQNYILKSSRKI